MRVADNVKRRPSVDSVHVRAAVVAGAVVNNGYLVRVIVVAESVAF